MLKLRKVYLCRSTEDCVFQSKTVLFGLVGIILGFWHLLSDINWTMLFLRVTLNKFLIFLKM